MKQLLKPGKYIVAVSGGVDSVVLLNMLSKIQGLTLVVAHFDHGIRQESAADRQFVESLAVDYGLPFEYAEGRLGKQVSEAQAREARYAFLFSIKAKYQADALVTAHHQDDVLETAIINLIRGTGRKGLSSLKSETDVIRPLLDKTKAELLLYAKDNSLTWREDKTNLDQKYMRNWIRHAIVPQLEPSQRRQLLEISQNASKQNQIIDDLLDGFIDTLDRAKLNKPVLLQLPHALGLELLAHWLRANNIREIDNQLLQRILIAVKTLAPGKTINVRNQSIIKVNKSNIVLANR